jgi:cytochrome c553
MKLLLCLALGVSSALSQTANIETCAGCHGPHGEGNAATGAPRLAGQPQTYLERQLDAYANGRRFNEVMVPIARGLTAADRAQLAALYANLDAPSASKRSADNARGRTLATLGDETLHVQACENCHGPGGTGFGGVTPYLAGFDARYLETALREWKEGRRNTDPAGIMPLIAQQLSDGDIKALAAHYSSLPPPQRLQIARKPASPAAEKTHPSAGSTPRGGSGVGGAEPRGGSGGSQGPGGGAGGR